MFLFLIIIIDIETLNRNFESILILEGLDPFKMCIPGCRGSKLSLKLIIPCAQVTMFQGFLISHGWVYRRATVVFTTQNLLLSIRGSIPYNENQRYGLASVRGGVYFFVCMPKSYFHCFVSLATRCCLVIYECLKLLFLIRPCPI